MFSLSHTLISHDRLLCHPNKKKDRSLSFFRFRSIRYRSIEHIASHCIPSLELSGSQMWMCRSRNEENAFPLKCFLCCFSFGIVIFFILDYCCCFALYFSSFRSTVTLFTVVIHFSSLVVAHPTNNNEIPSKKYNSADAMVMHRFFLKPDCCCCCCYLFIIIIIVHFSFQFWAL